MADETGTQLSDRAQHLFRLLVERHIRDGQPVGSRTLSRDSGLELSPATVRNVMADLEEIGLLRSPHTSAGRVPTVRGYRLFVDTLLKVSPLDAGAAERFRIELAAQVSADALVGTASQLLAEVTNLASMVMLPRHDHARLSHIEFLPLSGDRVLVILVFNDSEVQNRIIHTTRAYTRSELEQASNHLSQLCVGQDLDHLRQRLIAEMREVRKSMDGLMMAAIDVAEQAMGGEGDGDDMLVSGQTKLMSYGEFSDVDRLRQLFEAFREKRELLHLLDQAVSAGGVQIFIGSESGFDALDPCSVVTSPYRNEEGDVIGVLGVVGPTRMAYDRVIPVVDLTARLLGAALKQTH